ncbi:MAG: AAA family ATPase [Candidatus Nomurabacteria bacterium]|jgi:DNA polymerase III delta prime subunit|nr:AAA family ATPase [Candidatus Nomurabacteria bacterium]
MNFDDLILHQTTQKTLENYLRQPTHALLLTGENGVGLGTIAQSLAHEIAGANTLFISPKLHNTQKTATINVEDIRNLHELTRTQRAENFAIIIDDADKMTIDAPQAFLKLLEEPNAHIFYILTSHISAKLPLTILSRAQEIKVLPTSGEIYEKVFDAICHSEFSSESTNKDKSRLAQIKFLATGKPAEMTRLLTDEQYFRDSAATMETAKTFLQGSMAQRLKTVVTTTTHDDALILVQNIAKLVILMAQKIKNPAEKLNLISATIENLSANGNVKTQLLNLALNF